MSSYSIVEYLGESTKEKCGYCKQTGGYNSHGFWAHSLSVDDYLLLINRNWRRSGAYVYLPTNKTTCCPMYTIKSDAINFKLSRSHKKVLKKMNKFLRDGTKEKNFNRIHTEASTSSDPKPSKEHSNIEINDIKMEVLRTEVVLPKKDVKIEKAVKIAEDQKRSVNPLKKKVIRLERKKAKLAAKGLTLADAKPRHVNVKKSLEDFLAEEPTDGKHQLKVKLVQSNKGSSTSILDLYKKYQSIIHNDPPDKTTQRSYERFLVNSPLQIKLVSVADHGTNVNLSFDLFCKYESIVHKSTDNEFSNFNTFLVNSPLKFVKNDSTPPDGFGSFHYQYFLDGELIAVGVIDILPSCVSSVYFYYNPDYSFLSFGTYASLREIALVRELSKKCPDLTSYYLGFYIPTCPKMRYKANVKPSYLLCPEVYSWHLLDENLNKEMDAVRYRRINNEENDKDEMKRDDLLDVLVLANRTAMKYRDYKKLALKSRKKPSSNDSDEVFEYASKVGKTLSQKMLLYRS